MPLENNNLLVHSFDVFDTVLTRRVIEPTAIFLNVGEQLLQLGWEIKSPGAYRDVRILAERECRKNSDNVEVSFDQILNQLATTMNLTSEQRTLIHKLEINCEKSNQIVSEPGRRQLEKSREIADSIIFVSDMYFSDKEISMFLSEHDLLEASDRVFSSSTEGVSKHQGGLFPKIKKLYPSQTRFYHFGDKHRADYVMPRRHGWRAQLLTNAVPHSREIPLEEQRQSLDWMTLLGEMRHKRLHAETRLIHQQPAMYCLGLETVGPLLAAYTGVVQRWSHQYKITHLFCLAREGQILKQVFDQFTDYGYQMPKSKYLYTSRRSLQEVQSTITGIVPEWILAENNLLSLSTLLDRLSLNPAECRSSLEKHLGSFKISNKPLTKTEYVIIRRWIQSEEFQKLYRNSSGKSFKAAFEYFTLSGFMAAERPAICDVGWHGSMLSSLDAIRKHADTAYTPVRGFLLGTKLTHEEATAKHINALIERDNPVCRTLCFAEVMEIVLSADHGGVNRYIFENDIATVELDSEQNTVALDRHLNQLRQGVTDFVDLYLRQGMSSTAEDSDRPLIVRFAERNLQQLMTAPTTDEANVLGGWPFSTQFSHQNAKELAPAYSVSIAVRAGLSADSANQIVWLAALKIRNGPLSTMIFRLSRKISRYYRQVFNASDAR